jgi:hypothetical protein
MEFDLIFAEKQKFRQWWVILILLGFNTLIAYAIISQFFMGKPFGQNPMGNLGLIVTAVFVLLLSLLIFVVRMETQISSEGIQVRFFPFHLKFKKFSWDEISRCYVREYAPIGEFGGWGLRWGLFGQGNAWNVAGNRGLQMEFKNGKKLLIGTQKPDLMIEALEKIKNKK